MENILSTLGTDEYTSTKLFCMYISFDGPRMGKAEHMHQVLNFLYTCWEVSARLANPWDIFFSLSSSGRSTFLCKIHTCILYVIYIWSMYIYTLCMHIYKHSLPAKLRPVRFLYHTVQSNRDHVHILRSLYHRNRPKVVCGEQWR